MRFHPTPLPRRRRRGVPPVMRSLSSESGSDLGDAPAEGLDPRLVPERVGPGLVLRERQLGPQRIPLQPRVRRTGGPFPHGIEARCLAQLYVAHLRGLVGAEHAAPHFLGELFIDPLRFALARERDEAKPDEYRTD